MANTGLFICVNIAVFKNSFFETKVQYEVAILLRKQMKPSYRKYERFLHEINYHLI